MGLRKAIADLPTVLGSYQREKAEAGHCSSWVPALPRAGQGSGPSQALQVVLGVGPKVLIDAALQMNGQVGNTEDGPLHTYQALLQAPRGRVLKHKEDRWDQACRAVVGPILGGSHGRSTRGTQLACRACPKSHSPL